METDSADSESSPHFSRWEKLSFLRTRTIGTAVVVVLLVALPVMTYIVQQQTRTQQKANVSKENQIGLGTKRTLLYMGGLEIYIDGGTFQNNKINSGSLKTTISEEKIKRLVDIGAKGFAFVHNSVPKVDNVLYGLNRLSDENFEKVKNEITKLVNIAKSQGVDNSFIIMQVDSFRPGGNNTPFNVTQEADLEIAENNFELQAKFAKETGLKGIWIDAEPYTHNPSVWNLPNTYDISLVLAERYFYFGQRAMTAMLSEYPDIEVLLAPGLKYSSAANYLYLADFYAGMLSVSNEHGVVVTTEYTYQRDDLTYLKIIYCDEIGDCGNGGVLDAPSVINEAFERAKSYENGRYNTLKEIQKQKGQVALGYWPYHDDDEETLTSFESGIHNRTIDLEIEDNRVTPSTYITYSPRYVWLYDELKNPRDGQTDGYYWFRDSYTCPFRTTAENSPWPNNLPCKANITKKYFSSQAPIDQPSLPPGENKPEVSAEYSQDNSLKVSWSGLSKPNDLDWVGVFSQGASDQEYIDWFYLKSCSKSGDSYTTQRYGFCNYKLAINTTQKKVDAEFQVRLFNYGIGKVAESRFFTLDESSSPISLTETPYPTLSPIASVSPKPIEYITYNVTCHNNNVTPNQMCKNKGYSSAVLASEGISARGYFWPQCAGPTTKTCENLSCSLEEYDCVNGANSLSSQANYPQRYIKIGNPDTIYSAEDFESSCSGYNSGWYVRVACQ